MRDDLLLNFLVKEEMTKEELEVFDLDSTRNFIYLQDVAHAFLNGPFFLKEGEAYNLANPEHLSKRDILKRI